MTSAIDSTADTAAPARDKTCFKCKVVKPRTEFYAHPKMADGLLGKCKQCQRMDMSAVRTANLERYREYDRMRASEPHRRLLSRRVTAKWRIDHPERKSAQTAVGNAVRDGRLTPHPCWVCGKRAEAHHPDYSRPLEVVWLCPGHHKQTHALHRRAA